MSSNNLTKSKVAISHLGIVDYLPTWELQKNIAEDLFAGRTENTLLLLEHPSVYTAGRRTEISDRPQDGTPVVDVDRGGKITWHGLGQLIGYPIVKLKNSTDVVGFVREIESALIEACAELGIKTERICDRSGVWVKDANGDRKIAAIGIRVAKGVTTHGFAINVNPDLTAYDRIVPCGISDAGITSISKELGRNVTTGEVKPIIEKYILSALERVI
ncbi:MAG: lipoyl(octanoyl) transferase LipB [Actinobacteria bacterium]|nr:lipoyl(octanoyl) transferase LipB [Actinomycetota bacterium]